MPRKHLRHMQRLLIILVSTLAVVQTPAQGEDPVPFADPLLQATVEETLQVLDPTPTDMLNLTQLESVGTFETQTKGITSIEGLEFAVNLERLNLRLNLIGDLSPLAGLINLSDLNLSQNSISDLSPLAGLVNLTDLNIHANRLTDLGPLSGLTALRTLDLHKNDISDISPLADLTNLQALHLVNNDVEDISPLENLTNLKTLRLCRNDVRDISAVSDLTNVESLCLAFNRVRDLAPLSRLRTLETVDLSSNWISDISALQGLSNLRSLDLRWNYGLDEPAYAHQLQDIVDLNPGIDLDYTGNHNPPSQVTASAGSMHRAVRVSWNAMPSGPHYTSHYQVYRSSTTDSRRVPVGPWQTSLEFVDSTVEVDARYTYWVRLATDALGTDSSAYSTRVRGWAALFWLTVSSTPGGTVVTSKEIASIALGDTVGITAIPRDAALFSFAGWSGTAVDNGRVQDPQLDSTSVTIDDHYDLRAHFVTNLAILHVDDDAPNDLVPNDMALSDPDENGTPEHPFDRIQEAIDAATHGTTVLVQSGVYAENIDFLGKQITLEGIGFPVIEGSGPGPLVRFETREDPNCLMMGFVLTRGTGSLASAIYCNGSSPSLLNCLVVGNQAADLNSDGSAIYCIDSNAVFVNFTISDNLGGNQGGAITAVNSNITVTNSILWNNVPAQIVTVGSGSTTVTYSTIMEGGREGLEELTGQDVSGNISTDPLFAQPGDWIESGTGELLWVRGDYHLLSQAGRWNLESGTWQQDLVTSPSIDSGNRDWFVGDEPSPNGSIINVGAFGGTMEASKSVYP